MGNVYRHGVGRRHDQLLISTRQRSLDTLDGQDSGLGKFPYRAVIEEFPDLVSRVSEVSSGPLAPTWDNFAPLQA
jgi:hypothetical protein